ncbi:MAG: Flp pilus assembly complex ATPase component TadA [Candidatus Aenigmarchaeota archaeon]|nr:Flp pilus assembly complex ATPase component TadA [Candidatus Aenigmarchaeota archaeon]
MPQASRDYVYDEERLRLRINCLGYLYGPSLEDFPDCMARVMDTILDVKKVASVVLVGTREYEYDEDQVRLLSEMASVLETVIRERMISYGRLGNEACKQAYPEWSSRMQYTVLELLRRDPIGAYVEVVREIRHMRERMKGTSSRQHYGCYYNYVKNILLPLKGLLERTEMIRIAKPYAAGYHIGDRTLYREMFMPNAKPNFMLTRYMITPPEKGKSMDRYAVGDTQVEIYRLPESTQYLYFVVPPEFNLSEQKYTLLDEAKRHMAAHKPVTSEFVRSERVREIFYSIGKDTLRDVAEKMGISLTAKELDQLANILTRYTAGFGVLEILLSDERVQDIYVNSPIERLPILVFHQDYEECRTNLIPSTEDAESWATRLRIQSGRPLDEANPVLDTDLTVPGGSARFAVITKTLSPHGLGFAIRRHRDKPWTLPLFIKSGMLNPLAAGLLSFLIDGAVSILVAGGRGAGKTSLLGSMMLEILPKVRIITLEDTLELPVGYLKDLHYNIERLKTRSVITRVETEMPADEALRTALRLGDSALIVGEVRSSIPGWEEVLVIENGITTRVPIEKLENKDVKSYKVPTFGFDLKVGLRPLAGFVKHPVRDRFLEVVTKTGRRVTVTPDHSLFHATKDFRIAPVECKDLREGDCIVIPSSIPAGFNDVDQLDVTRILPDFRLENFEDNTREAIRRLGWKKATQVAGVKSGDIYNYFRTASDQQINLPIASFESLIQEAGVGCDRAQLKVTRGSGNSIPAVLSVNEDFCRFLGYYVSEGYYMSSSGKGGSVILTNSDEKLLADMINLSKSIFGMEPKLRKVYGLGESTQVRLGSIPLATLFSRLGSGRIAGEKRVPSIIFGLSRRKIAAFLRGLYSGDGSFTASKKSGNCVRYFTTSKKLAEDVAYLLLGFGIVGTIRHTKSRKPNHSDLWNVSFKDREMVETFLREIGFEQKQPKMMIKGWRHSNVNSVKLAREELRKHLLEYPRQYRHLFRFERCSKTYLKQVANDPRCRVSEQLKTFANGEFFLDEVKEIREIALEKPVPVYDLSVEPSQNFIGGFGGILLHNTEAKALYEAMRIGALSNVVAGTIHGESAYGVYDRVVNDLGVPPTSFKATDIIPIAKMLRSADGLHRFRRMTEITEVRKEWDANPSKEGGFVNLMEYSGKEDTLKPTDTLVNGESQVLNRIASYVKEWSGNWDSVWENIKLRAKIKEVTVGISQKLGRPELLEAEWVVKSNQRFHLIQEQAREDAGYSDPKRVYREWLEWMKPSVMAPQKGAIGSAKTR